MQKPNLPTSPISESDCFAGVLLIRLRPWGTLYLFNQEPTNQGLLGGCEKWNKRDGIQLQESSKYRAAYFSICKTAEEKYDVRCSDHYINSEIVSSVDE